MHGTTETTGGPGAREPIAIIGIGCRLPGGANDPRTFWRNLVGGVDAIVPVPAGRGDANAFAGVDPRSPGSTAWVRWGGFIDGIDAFDPEFFGISLREAPCVDPQHRLLLEAAWDALEDGGQVLDPEIAARTGVFVGISSNDYQQLQADLQDLGALDVHSVLGFSMSIAANRISYCLNLHGPSVAVDTACSSSLTAIHLACRSLWEGECGLALAGGVNALLTPAGFVPLISAAMLSPDGRCKTFDASANGFVRAEGAGVVALKPLAAALADGNPIYALVRGTAANQDGRTPGITVPNGAAQAALVREACRVAGVRPADIRYVEAHGTGTSVGDPIEANALGEVLGGDRADGDVCFIGSVKTNVGHLEAGAGVTGVIKTALVLQNRTVPPHLHLAQPNPLIDFDRLKLALPREAEPLPAGRLLAGVNSFGFGGANAHAVLESWDGGDGARTAVGSARAASRARGADDGAEAAPMRLLPLSAQCAESLAELARRYAAFLRDGAASAEDAGAWLRDVCYSATFHRKHHAQRLVAVGDSAEALAEKLEAFADGEARPGLVSGHVDPRRKIAFLFGGQGPQWWGMGRGFVAREPVFRATLEDCDRLIARAGADWSLLEVLAADEATSRIHDPAITQPAIFSLQVALAALWRSWGVEPEAVVGHSVGEIAAAHVGGALDLESAARVIFHRGRCMALAETGRMLAAAVSEEEATALVAGRTGLASIAAVNAPSAVTFAGDAEPLGAIHETLAARGTFARFVKVQYAFHSARMDPVREDLLGSLGGLEARALRVPMWSTVTGARVNGEPLDAPYWWRNVREPVRFSDAVREMAEREHNVFVELSPHPVLLGYVRESIGAAAAGATFTPSLRRGEDERATMLAALGTLHVTGHPVDFRALYPDGGRCLRLPRYAWRHQRYWQESRAVTEARLHPADHPLLGRGFRAARPYWEQKIGPELRAMLADHRVQGHVIFPAAGYLEMALAAGRKLFGADACVLEDVDFVKPLFVPETGEAPRLQLSYDPAQKEFSISSLASDAQKHWLLHCTGRLTPAPERGGLPAADEGSPPPDRVRAPCADELYERLDQLGFQYGPAFRRLEDLWRGEGEAVGGVALPADWNDAGYQVHPALLDGCFHAMLGLDLAAATRNGAALPLPARVRRVRLHARPGPKVESHVRVLGGTPRMLEVDVRLRDATGRVALEVEGLTLMAAESARAAGGDRLERSLYALEWQLTPLRPDASGGGEAVASADFLPRLEELGPLLERDMERLGRTGGMRRFVEVEPDIDHLCAAYVARAFENLGCDLSLGAAVSADAVRDRVVEPHRRVVEPYLSLLEADGVLVREGAGFRVARAPERGDLEAQWRSLFARFPSPGATLLRTCGNELTRLLTGEVEPLPLLFGETSFVDALYADGVEMRGAYRTVRQILRIAGERLPEHRKLRILEIGAGTGGLTAGVLPMLDRRRTDYLFTDRTSHFLTKAEERFGAYPFVRYETLDLERDPREQGFAAHAFDVIFAADVLHATESLRRTLGHVRTLLAPSGLLVALEHDKPPRWLDLVFALTKGWWCFRDADLRVDSPLLDRERWVRLLREEGFAEATSVAEPAEVREPVQCVLLGRGPAEVPADEPLADNDADAAADDDAAVAADATVADAPRGWLVFADADGVGEALAARLRALGDETVLVFLGEAYERTADDRFRIRPESRADLRRLLDEPIVAERLRSGVVFLWSADAPGAAEPTLAELDRAQAHGCLTALCLVQELEATARPSVPLWLVTRATQPAGAGGCASIPHATVWGLGRVLMNEHPGLRCHLVDLARAVGPGDAAALADELTAPDGEAEIALRGPARYGVRIVRGTTAAEPTLGVGSERPFRVHVDRPGVLDDLRFRPLERRRPGPGEVEVEVAAVALNFRDVMKAMGLYPRELPDSQLLGDECAGRIVAVGPGVTDFAVGDEVLALGLSCLQSHVVTPTHAVLRMPKGLSVEESVTLPTSFLTAAYALERLARLGRGERVLIHSAAGGVGLAAVQIARRAGAEIFATAGTARKRALLEAIGVEHVMDSRSLAFADEVVRLTGGAGVDVVLNSLAGDAVPKGMSLLAANGRFVEIGKRDVYMNAKVGLRLLRRGCSFHVFDLVTSVATRLAQMRGLWDELHAAVEAGELRPLPLRVFPVAQVAEGFRTMREGAHVGKIVFSFDDPVPVQPDASAAPSPYRADATYLVTGGLGGFGLAVARGMVDGGARHVVLMGRSGASSDEAKAAVAELRERAEVEVVAGDVADEAVVAELVARIGRTGPPLRGVVHGAMVLDDGVALQLDRERMQRVLAPKLLGAWNLHRATQGCPLDFFVCFSSFSAIAGNPGQVNYAAANVALDSLAHYRRARGLPGTSVNWGEIQDVGYIARIPGLVETLARRGLEGIPVRQALAVLERLLAGGPAQLGVMTVDWQRMVEFVGGLRLTRRFDAVLSGSAPSGDPREARGLARERLLGTPPAERRGAVETYVREQVARVLRTSPASLDPETPLSELGLDSLMAVELLNRLEGEVGVEIQAGKLATGGSTARLAELVFDALPAPSPAEAN